MHRRRAEFPILARKLHMNEQVVGQIATKRGRSRMERRIVKTAINEPHLLGDVMETGAGRRLEFPWDVTCIPFRKGVTS